VKNVSGHNIKVARVACRMQQIDLSAALEVDYNISLSQSTISEIEKGKRVVRDFELKAIAMILDVSSDALLKD